MVVGVGIRSWVLGAAAVLSGGCTQVAAERDVWLQDGPSLADSEPETDRQPEPSQWCDAEDPCGRSAYVGYPETLPSQGIWYVNACCGSAKPADGTLKHPFPDIGSALAAAGPGDTIAVAAGDYEGSVVFPFPLRIAGAGSDRCRLHSAGDDPTVVVDGVDGAGGSPARLSGFKLRGEGGLGLLVRDTDGFSAADLDVSDYGMGFEWSGVGIYTSNCQDLDLTNLRIRQNRAGGAVFSTSTGRMYLFSLTSNGEQCHSAALSVVNGARMVIGKQTTPFEEKAKGETVGALECAAGCVGDGGEILDSGGLAIFARDSMVQARCLFVAGSHGGGILLVDSVPEPGDDGSGHSTVAGCLLAGSDGFGLQAHRSSVSVVANAISSVLIEPGDYGAAGGDCIAAVNDASEPLSLEIAANDLSGCAQTGILVSGPLDARVAHNRLLGPGRGGIWLQQEAVGVEVESNSVDSAKGPGIVVSSGSRAALSNNKVLCSTALPGGEEMAHGIVLAGLTEPGAVHLAGNTSALSLQAGVVVDDCAEGSVVFDPGSEDEGQKANVVAGNKQVGIALNKAEGISKEDLAELMIFQTPEFGQNFGPDKSGLGDIAVTDEFPVFELRAVAGPVSVCVPPPCTE